MSNRDNRTHKNKVDLAKIIRKVEIIDLYFNKCTLSRAGEPFKSLF